MKYPATLINAKFCSKLFTCEYKLAQRKFTHYIYRFVFEKKKKDKRCLLKETSANLKVWVKVKKVLFLILHV